MKDFAILFVDDEKEILAVVKEYLSFQGYNVHIVDDPLKALQLIKKKDFDIVFTDLMMPKFNGLELLTAIKEYRPEIEVIILTGCGTIETAVQALKLGSYDYLQKPIELERLKILIERIIEKKRLQRENILIKRRLKGKHRFGDIVGVSSKLQDIYDIIEKVSENDFTVLIQGESGTGKELVARVIHQNSYRKDHPFVAVNCGAITESLLESELFGHVRGAFTGAIKDATGLFKAAEGGTIFLDEISEVKLSLQVKLLRVLQERKIRPIGNSREFDIDVRVIAATNRDPEAAIRDRFLREDLFYRLNVVPIKLPPLKNRKEDIPFLANHFMDKFNNGCNQTRIMSISSKAMDILLNYHWPGNVRQLENVIARAFALGVDDVIDADDLPVDIKRLQEISKSNKTIYDLRENEIILIRRALRKTGGNKVEAAKKLGINVSTLYRKMKKYFSTDDLWQVANR